MSTNYAHILPEVTLRRDDRDRIEPEFPLFCPACGARGQVDLVNWQQPASYDCGAAYTPKGQIQNHTDKWWGSCPVVKERNAQ